MRAVQISAVNQVSIVTVPDPIPGPGEVIVTLRAAALNRRDVWIKQGQYVGTTFPCFPGSDGAGVVTKLGANVDRSWMDRPVVINPGYGWGENPRAQGPNFAVLGIPRAGTLSEHIAIPVDQLSPKPDHLSWEQAGACPLAGVTAYRALFARAGLQSGERALITGIGGGVALMGLQFAVAAGAKVWVTSSSRDKVTRARSLGAQEGFDYRAADWAKVAASAAGGGFDVVLDSAGGAGFDSLINLTAAGGRIVSFGATAGNPPGFALRKIFWRQISILGSTMGSPRDWTDMLEFITRHRINPLVQKGFTLDQAADAFELMERSEQFGKIVLTPK